MLQYIRANGLEGGNAAVATTSGSAPKGAVKKKNRHKLVNSFLVSTAPRIDLQANTVEANADSTDRSPMLEE